MGQLNTIQMVLGSEKFISKLLNTNQSYLDDFSYNLIINASQKIFVFANHPILEGESSTILTLWV
jgi:hypothetical protein